MLVSIKSHSPKNRNRLTYFWYKRSVHVKWTPYKFSVVLIPWVLLSQLKVVITRLVLMSSYLFTVVIMVYIHIYSTMNIILSILKAKVPVSSMLRSHERNGRFQQSCDWQQYGTEFRRNIYHVNKYWICQLGLPLIHIVRGTVEANVIVWMLQFSSPCCCGTINSRSSINETWRWKVMNSPLLNCPVS